MCLGDSERNMENRRREVTDVKGRMKRLHTKKEKSQVIRKKKPMDLGKKGVSATAICRESGEKVGRRTISERAEGQFGVIP